MALLTRDDGPALHVEEAGAGSPLLLLHGWAMAGPALGPLAERLAARHRVVTADLRGHGRSADGPVTLGALAADAAWVLAALRLERAVLVGWSLGAQVALAAAPLARDRLAGLVLLGATPRFLAAPGWPHGHGPRGLAALEALVARSPGRARRRFLADCFAAGEPPGAAGSLEEALAPLPAPGAAALAGGLAVLAETDLRPTLGAIDLPALVLHGEADAVAPAGAARALAAALPAGRLELLPGLGHAPFLTRPDEVATRVAAFLEGLA